MKWTIVGKIFSLFGHYEVYNEEGQLVYNIQGEISWGGLFRVSNAQKQEVALIRRKVLSLLPTFIVEENGKVIGTIRQEFSFLRPKYNVQFLNWKIIGDIFQLHYAVETDQGQHIASIDQKFFSLRQEFTLTFNNPADGLDVVLLAAAVARVEAEQNNTAANAAN